LVPGATLKERLENLEKYGYEGIELAGGEVLKERLSEIKKATASSRAKPSTICTGVRGCLLASGKDERDIALSDIKMNLEMAAEMGAVGLVYPPLIAVTMGRTKSPRIPDLSPLHTSKDLERRLLVELLGEIGDYAEKVGSIFLIEPLNRYESFWLNTLYEGVGVCREVGKPSVKIMADFFHMSIEEADIAESLMKAKGYVYHVHLADSNRQLPGAGHTDFAKPFAALKEMGYDKYMALECRIVGDREKELPKSAEYLKQRM
jgi:sugar phosphate isomerase/epimerase